MAFTSIEVWDVTGNKKDVVEVPDDMPLNRIIVVLIDKLNYPKYDPNGGEILSKGLKLGTEIKISDMGTFIVKDRTSRRNRGNVDIYMTSYKKALRFGRQKHILVQNQEGLNLLNGKEKYVCILD